MRCYLFDIDGTVADIGHRLPLIQGEQKNWAGFFAACVDDKPIAHVCELVARLSPWDDDGSEEIIFVSGRSDEVRADTLRWLQTHVGPVHSSHLYMRAAGDHRPDYVVKAELLDRVLADGYEPIMAFEDRDQVVKMWRERGIPCAQVAEGAF